MVLPYGCPGDKTSASAGQRFAKHACSECAEQEQERAKEGLYCEEFLGHDLDQTWQERKGAAVLNAGRQRISAAGSLELLRNSRLGHCSHSALLLECGTDGAE